LKHWSWSLHAKWNKTWPNISTANDTPGRSTQTASPQSLPPTFTHSIQLENAARPASEAHNNYENLIPSSSLDFGSNCTSIAFSWNRNFG
jgi:hypothetical protein